MQPNSRVTGCFFIPFLFGGLILLVLFGYMMLWLPLRTMLFYVQTDCVILDKKLEHGDDQTARPLFQIEYTADGIARRQWAYDSSGIFTDGDWQPVLARFQVNQHYPCWFDPSDPDRVVLTRSISPWALILIVPLVLTFVGIGGLAYARRTAAEEQQMTAPQTPRPDFKWMLIFLAVFPGGFFLAGAASFLGVLLAWNAPPALKMVLFVAPMLAYGLLIVVLILGYGPRMMRMLPSPERSAANQARQSTAFSATERVDKFPISDDATSWPTIPQVNPAPGRELAYELKSNTSQGGTFLVALLAAVFWNGIVSVFAYHMIDGHLRGKPEWFLTIFLIPFFLVGIFLLCATIGTFVMFIAALLAGKVRLEISAHPLLPGGACDFLFQQSGLRPLEHLRFKLTCTESATYRAGTSSTTKSHEAYGADIADVGPAASGGQAGALNIPADAMHSFKSGHNEITWKLTAGGRVLGFLPVNNDFVVTIVPFAPASEAA